MNEEKRNQISELINKAEPTYSGMKELAKEICLIVETHEANKALPLLEALEKIKRLPTFYGLTDTKLEANYEAMQSIAQQAITNYKNQ